MNSSFRSFVENNPRLVTRKESKRYPGLFVFKYTKKVFFDNMWSVSPHLLNCRGLVLGADWNAVVVPFTKIFNYQENEAASNWNKDDTVFVTKKVNGFMAGLTNYNGELIISTTGSLDSDFVDYAREYLKDIRASDIVQNHTYLFEIVHPEDPHIIPEKVGAHFLSIVNHNTRMHYYKFDCPSIIENAVEDFSKLGIHVDDENTAWNFGDLLKHIKTVKHEGYVIVHSENDETIKIKSPYYLFQKFLARTGTKRLIDGMRTGTIKERIDEEYYTIISKVSDFGVVKFSELSEQNRLELLRGYFNE